MSTEQTPLLSGAPHGATEPSSSGAVTPPIPAALAGKHELPMNIGHRGYKAAFPENSMAAFHGAVAAGAHALETDLHLSRDGVVVLSHDATLKRCFGIDKRIADCDWDYLSTLRSLQAPHEPMPRLADLLAWLAQPEREGIWLLLDIKLDDDPAALFAAVAEVVASVDAGRWARSWRERIVVGGWNEHYLNHARQHLPGFPLAYIGTSLLYAKRFLSDDHPDVHFNLLQTVLVGPVGAAFRRAIRRRGRKLLVWTVNERHWMEWSVRKGVDGVITDQVGRFADVRKGWHDEASAGGGVSSTLAKTQRRGASGWPRVVRLYVRAFVWQGAALLLTLVFWRRLSSKGALGSRQRPLGVRPEPIKT